MAWLGGFQGDGYTREEFRAWLRKQKKPSFLKAITIHATGAPYTLASAGGSQRIKNLAHYYKTKGWKGGPHWFVMEDKIYPGTPPQYPTVHSPSRNGTDLALEVEGLYNGKKHSHLTGTGGVAWKTAHWAVAEILDWMQWDADAKHIRFHRTDPATTHKVCPSPPGVISEAWFAERVRAAAAREVPAALPAPELPPLPQPIGNPTTGVTTKQVQERLKVHGFDPGPIDDKWGPKTRKAVLDFQAKLGLSYKPALEKATQAQLVGPYTWYRLTKEPPSTGILTPPVAPPKPDVPLLPPPVTRETPVAQLHPSQFAIDWMKRFEGLRLEAYDDVGSWAIGYGHNATSRRPPIPFKGMKITEAEADNILRADAEAIAAEVRKVLKGWAFTQDQFDALVLNCFQLGQTAFTKNRATKKIKANGSDKEVYEQLVAQANATPNAGLKRRRMIQAQIWNGEKPTKW
jgi:GH24 family phage-related lysozyme (muramidase)